MSAFTLTDVGFGSSTRPVIVFTVQALSAAHPLTCRVDVERLWRRRRASRLGESLVQRVRVAEAERERKQRANKDPVYLGKRQRQNEREREQTANKDPVYLGKRQRQNERERERAIGHAAASRGHTVS